RKMDVLSQEDLQAVKEANALLMRLRNEMHFHSGKPNDTLDRAEQLRITEWLDYHAPPGMLPVERFMQDYFRATHETAHVTTRFVARALSQRRVTQFVNAVFGHHVQGDLSVGPAGIVATSQGLQQQRGNLTAIMRMADLANLYNKPIEPQTWEAVRREAPNLPEQPEPQACEHFLSMMNHPGRLEALLRDLHDTRVLDRFVPAIDHARGLLQFNQYHKYTVDEHCLRAVGFAAGLMLDMGPLGRIYREIEQKRVLHLALLIHDLGKGFEEDHCAIGATIAEQTAERLGMPPDDAEDLEFLVEQHLLMNHLAFNEDASDAQLVERFATQVGSPERLRMLFVLTAADLTAVGPDVWDDWKAQVVGDLFERTMAHFKPLSH
ncbi:MAG TPA: HD domain-containing protein, partial [Thermoguttaceae bacterium]|nr:HD domain-containing protein [Thermoguttaceae bacterium]